MLKVKFTQWAKWFDRESLNGIRHPGVYVCAHSDEGFFPPEKFDWVKQVIYIGMTNSVGGLKARLKQFDNTIRGKTGHGGADRVRYKYQNYQKFADSLYVAIASFPCDVKSNNPEDLRIMGEVAKFEYDCFAEFVQIHGALPEFNNKVSAPKFSLTIGRSNNN